MIKIVCVGKIKTGPLKDMSDDYQKRIGRYDKIEILEVKDEAIKDNDTNEHIIEKEGRRILEKVSRDEYVIILDLKGKMYDSITFSDLITKKLEMHKVTFVIGGSLGIAKEVKERADMSLKLSDMTFLHQMARVIILEQIYRAFKIKNHETYHK